MPHILIEIPDNFNQLATALPEFVSTVLAAVPVTKGGRAVDYAGFETDLGEATAQLERSVHADVLSSLDVDRERVIIDGQTYVRVGRYPGNYHTMTGTVIVKRSLYRQAEARNAKTVDPISLRCGCLKGWLPKTADAMAFHVQQGTSREAEQTGRKTGRLAYSHSAYHDVAHLVGEKYVWNHENVEARLIDEYELPAEARSVSLSLDRVSLPMEEPRPRPVGRPRKDAPKNPIERNFRQAYCGTVTVHDAEGKALHTIRYGRMPQGDAIGLCEGMAADVEALLRKRQDLQVAMLQDGAHELWNLLRAEVNESSLGVAIHEMIDLWHLMEKLGKAAVAIYGAVESRAIVKRWHLLLKNSESAAAVILKGLRESGLEWKKVGDGHPVHEAITYLENHAERMNYAAARAAGLPVGSGQIEATCKSLVAQRMKRSGARWKETTGEHILQLRALALSDRWDSAIGYTLAPLRKAVVVG